MQVRENEGSYFPHSENSYKNPQLWKKADIPLFPLADITMSHGFVHFDSLSPVVQLTEYLCRGAFGSYKDCQHICASGDFSRPGCAGHPPRTAAGQHTPGPSP